MNPVEDMDEATSLWARLSAEVEREDTADVWSRLTGRVETLTPARPIEAAPRCARCGGYCPSCAPPPPAGHDVLPPDEVARLRGEPVPRRVPEPVTDAAASARRPRRINPGGPGR